MSLLFDLLDQIDRYVVGKSGGRDLGTWVVANLQRTLDSGDATAIRLVNEIDALFVEVGENIIDRATLHSRLAALVQQARTRPAYVTGEQVIKALSEYGYRLAGKGQDFAMFEHPSSPPIYLTADMSKGIPFTDLLDLFRELNETQLDLDDFTTRLAFVQFPTLRS